MPGSKREDARGPWLKGVNNRLPDRLVPSDALRNAVNVELRADGTLRRRRGYTSVSEGVYHSLWCEHDIALAVKDNALVLIDPTDLSESMLETGLSGGNRMVYVWTPLGVYLSNGAMTGRVVNGVLRAWGVEHAHAQPTLSAVSAGAMDAGRYQVAITYEHSDGEEGGTTAATAVTVSNGGGIQAAAIPQPALLGDVSHINVYVSQANGDRLYHYGRYPTGTTSVTISRSATLGRELTTQFLYPMPAGNVLEEYNGRLYVAVGSLLWFSEPFYYGQRRAANYFQFPAPISIVSRAGNAGLHVVADQHYFLRGGDPAAFVPEPVLAATGVRGSLVKLPPDGARRAWVSSEGIVVSTGDGSLELQMAEQVMIEAATEGASLYQERDGETLIVASLNDGQSAAVAGDFVDAEIIRRS